MKNIHFIPLFICLIAISLTACGGDEEPTTGESTAGESTAGESTAGESTAGESTAGESTAGESTAGESTAGESTAGESTAGESTAGESTAGESTAGEGTAGEMTEMTEEEQKEAMAQRAYEWLTGRFDSVAQAMRQPSYFEIQLLGCEAKAEGLGDRVLYIEQAVVESADQPYRQRLYNIDAQINEMGEIEVISTIYSLTLPDAYIGLCSDTNVSTLSPSSYELREGCEVYLKWMDDHFEGSTRGEGCLSELNGASYATSEVYLSDNLIRSWDRGYNAEGEQMWGAVDGAYEFIRQE